MNITKGYAVPIIGEVKILNEFVQWKKDYNSLVFLQFVCEVLNFFIFEENKDPEVFTLVYDLLNVDVTNKAFSVSVFLLKLLQLSGNISNLDISIESERELNSDNAYIIPGRIGYSEKSEIINLEKISSRIYKTQRFILNEKFTKLLLINLSQQEIVKMLKLHLDWIELVTERELKSKKILYQILA
ncbi:MAG: DNA repair protein RecO C-terminal domain-containing protein [Candidatus Dojkabacteria bacterium]|nr:DNA repair protein RecO C-terminal domain-containing protein [Candidatus Dojkabacteria bacterium]